MVATKKSAVKKVAAKIKKVEVAEKAEKITPAVESRYFEAKGGRKTAIARARVFTKKKGIIVNGKDYKAYFTTLRLQKEVEKPFEAMNVGDKVGAEVKVSGSGIVSQAEAVSHGIARALVVFNADFRKRLRKEGLLSRDPREVERKKYGLKKARRAPQWAKR